MQIVRNPIGQSQSLALHLSLAIGNFDGLHRGHQALLQLAKRAAAEKSLQSGALSFDPPPEIFFRGSSIDGQRLFTLEQKTRSLTEFGIDIVVIENFTSEFSSLTSSEFIETYLLKHLGIDHLCVGEDFRFGRGRVGDIHLLEENARNHKFSLEVCPPVIALESPISSSRIRSLLRAGDIKSAAMMLGRPYLLEGKVIAGRKLGRTIGIPTMNLGGLEQLLPHEGVYAAYCALEPKESTLPFGILTPSLKTMHHAVVNIGYRPTVDQQRTALSCEAHIYSREFGADALYDSRVGLYFVERLRPEMKFSDLEELRTAIKNDISKAKTIL